MDTISTIEMLKQRFEAAKLQTKTFSREEIVEDEDGQEKKVEKQHIVVSIPEERDFKNIIIADDDEIEKVQESEIEKYRFIKGYEAIWFSELKCVECEIEAQENLIMAPRGVMRRLKNLLTELEEYRGEGEEGKVYEMPSPKEGIKILIGFSTLEFTILQNFQLLPQPTRPSIHLRIGSYFVAARHKWKRINYPD